MAMALKGPYSLALADIMVNASKKGVYILSRDGMNAHYIGRSDIDLQQRLKSFAGEGHGYNFFWFHYATTSWKAYQSELYWYRHFWPYLDNSMEPAAPSNIQRSPSRRLNQLYYPVHKVAKIRKRTTLPMPDSVKHFRQIPK
jgi:hypothetical protein